MSMDILPIDTNYIEQNFQYINKDNIQYIVNKESAFTAGFVCEILFQYLIKTKYIDTTILYYNNRIDIQSPKQTEIIKEHIKNHFIKSEVNFIKKATDYIPLFGEDYIFNIILYYLIKTHKTEAIITQLYHINNDYKEKLLAILFSFHNKHREYIDDNFVEPFICKSNKIYLEPLLTEDYIINIIEAYIDNTKNYKQAIIYANSYSFNAKIKIENYLITKLTEKEYMHLWEEELCDNLPKDYLDFYFDDKEYKYSNIEKWIEKKRITEETIISALQKTLIRIQGITYYRYFRTEYLIYVFLNKQQWNDKIILTINKSNLEIFKWTLNPIYTDYETICKTFILFPGSIQIKIFKFIFLCIAQGKLKIIAEDLQK